MVRTMLLPISVLAHPGYIGTTKLLFFSSLRRKHYGMPQPWRGLLRSQSSNHGLRHMLLLV